jgi:hypothetical protein
MSSLVLNADILSSVRNLSHSPLAARLKYAADFAPPPPKRAGRKPVGVAKSSVNVATKYVILLEKAVSWFAMG